MEVKNGHEVSHPTLADSQVFWGYFPNHIGKVNRNVLRPVPDDFKSVRRIGQSGPDNAV